MEGTFYVLKTSIPWRRPERGFRSQEMGIAPFSESSLIDSTRSPPM